MDLNELQKNWNKFGRTDPFWAIYTLPEKKGNRWKLDEFFETGRREIDSVMEYIKSLGINLQRRRSLDFGCGVGRSTQALAIYFDEVVGVDIAPSMLKLAKKYNRFGVKCKYFLNKADNLNLFADDSFDFIYSIIVLQHISPQISKGYIRDFLRILTPGGILIFQLPNERNRYPIKGANPLEVKYQGSKCMSQRMRKVIKSLLPEPVLTLYRNVRDRDREPIMEMYGMKQEEVVELLKEDGAQIVDIVQDEAAGPDWVSYQYCVTVV